MFYDGQLTQNSVAAIADHFLTEVFVMCRVIFAAHSALDCYISSFKSHNHFNRWIESPIWPWNKLCQGNNLRSIQLFSVTIVFKDLPSSEIYFISWLFFLRAQGLENLQSCLPHNFHECVHFFFLLLPK